jgi:hypothetical protein
VSSRFFFAALFISVGLSSVGLSAAALLVQKGPEKIKQQ